MKVTFGKSHQRSGDTFVHKVLRLFLGSRFACRIFDSSRDDGEGAVLFAGGADDDLDVLAKGGEKFHEAGDEEVAGAVAHEQGDLSLRHAENFDELDLALEMARKNKHSTANEREKRDFSLRRPPRSQERT